MKRSEWKEKALAALYAKADVEITSDDQAALQTLLSGSNALLPKMLAGALIASLPPAAAILGMDLSTSKGVQDAAKLQGSIRGVNNFLEALYGFAAESLPEGE